MAVLLELLEREVLDQAGEVTARPLLPAREREGEQVQDGHGEHRGPQDLPAAAALEAELVEAPPEHPRQRRQDEQRHHEHDEPHQQVAVADLALPVAADRQHGERQRDQQAGST